MTFYGVFFGMSRILTENNEKWIKNVFEQVQCEMKRTGATAVSRKIYGFTLMNTLSFENKYKVCKVDNSQFYIEMIVHIKQKNIFFRR